MLVELGQELANLRDSKGVSLEAIAKPAKISGAYLHKLEAGKVNNPSPRVLARLAAVLETDYLALMELAGYLDEMQLAKLQLRTPRPHPLADEQLTPDEWRAVGAFAKKLIAKRKREQ